MEAGAYARMWNTAVARKIAPNPFIEATGTSLKLRLPQGALPETELEWKVPEAWNALERNRARAYCIPYTALVAMVVTMPLLMPRLHALFAGVIGVSLAILR